LPKTCLTPRMPWDRLPLSPLESEVYRFIVERVSQGFPVPGIPSTMKKLGCTHTAVRGAMDGLVAKGWLGESGERHKYLYINDRPRDIDD